MKLKYLLVTVFIYCITSPLLRSASEPYPYLANDEIQRKIVGTWIAERPSVGGASITGTVTILLDGSFVAKANFIKNGQKKTLGCSGRWQVKNGFLVETVTESNFNSSRVGVVTRDKILKINDSEFTFQAENGTIETRKRKTSDNKR